MQGVETAAAGDRAYHDEMRRMKERAAGIPTQTGPTSDIRCGRLLSEAEILAELFEICRDQPGGLEFRGDRFTKLPLKRR